MFSLLVFLTQAVYVPKPWYCFYIRLQYQRLRGKKWRERRKIVQSPLNFSMLCFIATNSDKGRKGSTTV